MSRRRAAALRAGPTLRAGLCEVSADVFDDADEFVGAVALAAGEVDELLGPLDDGSAFGRRRDGDAAAASELESLRRLDRPGCPNLSMTPSPMHRTR